MSDMTADGSTRPNVAAVAMVRAVAMAMQEADMDRAEHRATDGHTNGPFTRDESGYTTVVLGQLLSSWGEGWTETEAVEDLAHDTRQWHATLCGKADDELAEHLRFQRIYLCSLLHPGVRYEPIDAYLASPEAVAAMARAAHQQRGPSHWKRHPQGDCPNCQLQAQSILAALRKVPA